MTIPNCRLNLLVPSVASLKHTKLILDSYASHVLKPEKYCFKITAVDSRSSTCFQIQKYRAEFEHWPPVRDSLPGSKVILSYRPTASITCARVCFDWRVLLAIGSSRARLKFHPPTTPLKFLHKPIMDLTILGRFHMGSDPTGMQGENTPRSKRAKVREQRH